MRPTVMKGQSGSTTSHIDVNTLVVPVLMFTDWADD